MASTSVEDYLKAICEIESEGQRATTRVLATRVGVRMASVTGMMKYLHKEGYIQRTPYRGVQLTGKGKRLALRVLRRHRTLETFLYRTLGLSWDEVHAEAENLEHAISDRLVERMHAFLGGPQFDPHGAPIPQADGRMPVLQGHFLAGCEAGHDGQILHVPDKDPVLLRYLAKLGLEIGQSFRVMEIEPLGGAMTLRVNRRKVTLSRLVAEKIVVSSEK